MKYNVYVPEYTATRFRDEKGNTIYDVKMKKIGVANSMQDAKSKFGGYPILGE